MKKLHLLSTTNRNSSTRLAFLLTLLFVVSTLVGCSSTACLEGRDLRGFSITLEKGACFGQCPTYKATIYGDMSVVFAATAFVEPPRAPKGVIEVSEMCELMDELDVNEFGLTRGELAPVVDAPVTKITVKRGALTHTVEWNLTIPKNLRKLHDILESQTYRNPSLLKP